MDQWSFFRIAKSRLAIVKLSIDGDFIYIRSRFVWMNLWGKSPQVS